MKSAVLIEKNKIEMEERDEMQPLPGEVIVRIQACGICRTDVKCFQEGQKDLRYPRVLGHEMVGRVHAVGEGVTGYTPRSLVQVSPGVFCGECAQCRAGHNNRCESIDILGFTMDGGFQEYVRVPARGVANGILNMMPEGLTALKGSFAEPLACCINMQDKMNLKKLEPLLIIGAGRVGVLQMMLAKTRGVRKVLALETSELRRKQALELGFDGAYAPDSPTLVQDILKTAGPRGIGAVIQCCPFGESTELGMRILKPGGSFGYFSGLKGLQEVDWNLVHYKEIHMTGAYGCTAGQNAQALELLLELPVDRLVGKTLLLERLEEGLMNMRDLEELYSVIITDETIEEE